MHVASNFHLLGIYPFCIIFCEMRYTYIFFSFFFLPNWSYKSILNVTQSKHDCSAASGGISSNRLPRLKCLSHICKHAYLVNL